MCSMQTEREGDERERDVLREGNRDKEREREGVCVCVCVSARALSCAYVCMHSCVYVYTHACVCARLCVCVCVHKTNEKPEIQQINTLNANDMKYD